MDVGVNYPCVDYGWDFGNAPPTWRPAGTSPRWTTLVNQDLQRFRQIGIKVVRWFILGDGLTYGSGSDAPTFEGNRRWRFTPPRLDPEFTRHFEMLLDRFVAANTNQESPIQLMPVLIDFLFCRTGDWPVGIEDDAGMQTVPDPDWVKQGRAEAITDPAKRRVFVQQTLGPLLAVAASTPARRAVIHSWDIINEPEWVTNGWHPYNLTGLPVNEADMRAFIEDAKTMVRARQFKPTVGYAKFATINRAGIALDVYQPHHYANGVERLAQVPTGPTLPFILGEFATGTSADVWPDLRSGQSVLNRLRLAASKGYDMAMPWSRHRQGQDDRADWGPAVEAEIECFVFGRNCPP